MLAGIYGRQRFAVAASGVCVSGHLSARIDRRNRCRGDCAADQAGIQPSVGCKGYSYDNALGETINGLHKAELIHRRVPWESREAVELVTPQWVHWFNHVLLLTPIGGIPPAEAEANYSRQLAASNT